jgi:DNA-binding response OmpR family regulator
MTSICPIARRVGATTVAIVDSCPADYAATTEAVHRPSVTWHFLATGQEALRLARSEYVDLWVVNAVLVDMSGIDLCSMLRNRSTPATVYVVTDAYRAADEQAARICGASLFGCKPMQAEWFSTLTNTWGPHIPTCHV